MIQYLVQANNYNAVFSMNILECTYFCEHTKDLSTISM